jgi:hypothetical protein
MKRKIEEPHAVNGKGKKRAMTENDVRTNFGATLFDSNVLDDYRAEYATSKP